LSTRKMKIPPLVKDKSLIYASWHQRFFPGVTFFAARKPIAIMISKSRDGEFIAKVADILGWHPIRGSSSKGGVSALIKLKKRAAEGYRIGHIVDGPKGPFGSVKPGIVMMAQATRLAIVPVITSAEKHWQAKSWDRFMIPKPFTRIIIRFGEPFYVPRRVNSDQFEEKRKRLKTGWPPCMKKPTVYGRIRKKSKKYSAPKKHRGPRILFRGGLYARQGF
jgi:lysophospholipid acyltransferase (LPLAT)-like uncharacterized protein